MTLLPKCCTDFEIAPLDLLFPARMSPEGMEFTIEQGFLNVSLEDLLLHSSITEDGKLRIQHRCNQLGDDGLCKIYTKRPKICRDFDCSKRSDCACKGKGIIERSLGTNSGQE